MEKYYESFKMFMNITQKKKKSSCKISEKIRKDYFDNKEKYDKNKTNCHESFGQICNFTVMTPIEQYNTDCFLNIYSYCNPINPFSIEQNNVSKERCICRNSLTKIRYSNETACVCYYAELDPYRARVDQLSYARTNRNCRFFRKLCGSFFLQNNIQLYMNVNCTTQAKVVRFESKYFTETKKEQNNSVLNQTVPLEQINPTALAHIGIPTLDSLIHPTILSSDHLKNYVQIKASREATNGRTIGVSVLIVSLCIILFVTFLMHTLRLKPSYECSQNRRRLHNYTEIEVQETTENL